MSASPSALPTVLLLCATVIVGVLNALTKRLSEDGKGLGLVGGIATTVGCWIVAAIPILPVLFVAKPQLLVKKELREHAAAVGTDLLTVLRVSWVAALALDLLYLGSILH